MPVFGLLIDHRMGTHTLQPSSTLSARPFSDHRCRTMRYSRNVDNRMVRPATANGQEEDPNVVIAAYGTQVTLHRNNQTKPTKSQLNHDDQVKRKTGLKQEQRVRILIPSENEAASAIKKQSSEQELVQNVAEGTTVNSNAETGEISPRRASSSCSSEDLIDIYSLESNFPQERIRPKALLSLPGSRQNVMRQKDNPYCRTAWEKTSCDASVPGVATFVDLESVGKQPMGNGWLTHGRTDKTIRSAGEGTRNQTLEDQRKTASLTSGCRVARDTMFTSAASGCIPPFRVTIDKFGKKGVSSQCLISEVGRRISVYDAPNRIKDVWCARHKNEVSAKMEFRHETLRRPKSAFASVPLGRTTSDEIALPGTAENYTENPNGISKPIRKRSTKRKGRPKSAFPRTKEISPYCAPSPLAPGTCALLDAKALIRRNHRPTTAIKYYKPDKGTIPSITPCVRKAKVSHAMYVVMHNHNPELIEENTTTEPRKVGVHSTRNRSSQSCNLSLNASGLSKLSRPDKNEALSKVGTEDRPGTPRGVQVDDEDPASCGERDEAGTEKKVNFLVNSVRGDESFPDFKQVASAEKPGIDAKNTEGNCEPLRLLLEQEQPDRFEIFRGQNISDTNDVTANPNHSLVVKIPPLSAAYVQTLEEDCLDKDPQFFEIARKNSMIRRWLEKIETSVPTRPEPEGEVQSFNRVESS